MYVITIYKEEISKGINKIKNSLIGNFLFAFLNVFFLYNTLAFSLSSF